MNDELFHLPVRIGDVELKNPFVVASGPTTKRIEQLELAERCGWAAASLKHTFNPAPYISYEPRYRWLKKEKLHIFTAEHRLDMETGSGSSRSGAQDVQGAGDHRQLLGCRRQTSRAGRRARGASTRRARRSSS